MKVAFLRVTWSVWFQTFQGAKLCLLVTEEVKREKWNTCKELVKLAIKSNQYKLARMMMSYLSSDKMKVNDRRVS